MADIHIDDFFHDCAKTLVHLYNTFPRLTSLYVDDIIIPEPVDEFGLPSRRHQACFDSFLWLAREGYIHYEQRVRLEGLDQVVLTEKSFLRLSLPSLNVDLDEQPEHIAQKRGTLGWQFRAALRSGTTHQLNQLCQHFFTIKS
ncbi:hypothetical protein [Endozoicomonas numazuensis]|uniref:Uncharacterized protein n=1 Tax=Endozoicomonas numazuensis TaxID=1137799 RepID=A0A081NG27_9GAMM|nr:hypothetical protein [Endozoicomonas numazuensis]KEQ17400.1 hypothetical protein GZ78_16540 [Endozoicomonas numazuensis]